MYVLPRLISLVQQRYFATMILTGYLLTFLSFYFCYESSESNFLTF